MESNTVQQVLQWANERYELAKQHQDLEIAERVYGEAQGYFETV